MEDITRQPAGETATIPSEPALSAETAEGTPEPENGLQEPVTLPVRFNKQEYQLSLEDAAAYAQKGMKYDTLVPMLDKFRSLAKQRGQSPATFLSELCGEERDAEERIAEEFAVLCRECPDVTAFEQVPREAVKTALTENIPLAYAYLLYRYREQRDIDAATRAPKAASDASAGPMRGEPSPAGDPLVEAMRRGIWG